jgi:thioredoxin reductase (NADPH)
MVWFSTPELLEIGDVPFVVSTVRPTRVDTLNYYQKVVRRYGLDIRPFDSAEEVRRREGGFHVRTGRGKEYHGRNVVVATGYFDNPNRLGVPGEDPPHVLHYYDQPFEYFDRDVVVVGGRNSAVEAALDLYRHGARVSLVHRGAKLSDGVKYWILPDIENRIKSGEVAAHFRSTVERIAPEEVEVRGPEGVQRLKAGVVFVLIGFRPDTSHLRKFGIEVDPETLAPRSEEGSFATNVPGLYVAGSVVAGKYNNKIFVENGRLHGGVIVRSILAAGKRNP